MSSLSQHKALALAATLLLGAKLMGSDDSCCNHM